jgi:GT2 family glycosyltransferase
VTSLSECGRGSSPEPSPEGMLATASFLRAMERPLVTVMVPSLGRPYSMSVVMGNLQATGLPRERVELIITQNGTPQASMDWEKISPSRLNLESRNLGIAGALNQMLDQSSGEYLCVMDDDIEYDYYWLGELLDVYRGLELAGKKPGQGSIRCNSNEASHDGSLIRQPSPLGVVLFRPTSTVFGIRFFSRQVFREVGYFCEGYGLYGFEDVDFCERLNVGGYTSFNLAYHRGRNLGDENPDPPEMAAGKMVLIQKYRPVFKRNALRYAATGKVYLPRGSDGSARG